MASSFFAVPNTVVSACSRWFLSVTSGEADAKKDRSMTQTDLETWSWKPEVGRFPWESDGNLGSWESGWCFGRCFFSKAPNIGNLHISSYYPWFSHSVHLVGGLEHFFFPYIWVNYNDLTATEPWKSWLGFGNHPQMALFQVSELL